MLSVAVLGKAYQDYITPSPARWLHLTWKFEWNFGQITRFEALQQVVGYQNLDMGIFHFRLWTEQWLL